MEDVYLVSAVRSAVGKGKKDGGLASVHPVDLSAQVMNAAIRSAGVDPATIDDIYWGCAMPEASQGLNVARLASLRAGIPVEVPSATINRFCSSGLQTIALGAQQIMSGMADVVMAGGVEMISHATRSREHRVVHRHGLHRGACREPLESFARRSGSLGARQPAEGRPCARGRNLRRPDRSDRSG